VTPSITSMANGASFRQAFAPGMLLTVFGSQLALSTSVANTVPLPTKIGGVSATVNGIAAGLYYASPGQVNLQVPDAAGVGPAVVTITTTDRARRGPSRWRRRRRASSPTQREHPCLRPSAKRGDVIALYVTGTGASLQGLTVTVGGVAASVQYAGIRGGLVGVVQVNYQVPAGVAPGAQAVVVTVAGVPSPPATLTVQVV